MERIDDLQCKGLKFIQDDRFFPFGTDGVELANFVTGTPKDRALDIGCGSGIVTVLLAGKKNIPTVGVELQKPLADLASRNIALNNLSSIASVLNMRAQDLYEKYPRGSFTIVASNPPYRKAGSGESSLSDEVRTARHEVAINLTEILDLAAYMLGSGGKLYLVHQTERLDEVLEEAAKRKLMPKALQILLPSENKPPHIFLLKCLKDGRRGLDVKMPRIVYGSTAGDYLQ